MNSTNFRVAEDIVYVGIDQIYPHPDNPRKYSFVPYSYGLHKYTGYEHIKNITNFYNLPVNCSHHVKIVFSEFISKGFHIIRFL